MADVSGFLNRAADTASSLLGIGIAGFQAYCRVRESVTRTSTVPTAHVEDGSYLNDHVILEPLELTIEGNVSDIWVASGGGGQALLSSVNPALGAVAGLLPARTQQQIDRAGQVVARAQDVYRRAQNAIGAGAQLLDMFGLAGGLAGFGGGNRSQFIQAMEALQAGRQAISIDAPYKTYPDMLITSVTTERDNQRDILTYAITARQVRYAKTTASKATAGGSEGASSGATGGVATKGAVGAAGGKTARAATPASAVAGDVASPAAKGATGGATAAPAKRQSILKSILG